jgi:hypothetical protein
MWKFSSTGIGCDSLAAEFGSTPESPKCTDSTFKMLLAKYQTETTLGMPKGLNRETQSHSSTRDPRLVLKALVTA